MLTISGLGRLGKAPTMQYTPAGSAVTNLNVAVTTGYGDKKETTWLSLVAFGQQAEVLNQYLSKGSRLAFSAEITKVNGYTKKDETIGVNVDARILSFSFVDKAETTNEPEEF